MDRRAAGLNVDASGSLEVRECVDQDRVAQALDVLAFFTGVLSWRWA
jgi:hypothetical protein